MDSDRSDDRIDYIQRVFGNDRLNSVPYDQDRIEEILREGYLPTEDNIRAACQRGNLKTLQQFLATGVDFDARSRAQSDPAALVEADWADKDVTPRFAHHYWFKFQREDRDDWYAIQHVAYTKVSTGDPKDRQYAVMSTLLDRQPPLFAVYPQRLETLQRGYFPSEMMLLSPEVDLGAAKSALKKPSWGLRSLLHALLEDGARVDPILNRSDSNLDIERCDPQGRTLFLSMCRNSIGADARIDAVFHDAHRNRVSRRPGELDPFSTTETVPSLFQWFVDRGANPLAVDNQDKNALHHLLESEDNHTHGFRATGIRNSLLYMLKHCPTLINHKDLRGNYPIHTALQRLRGYTPRYAWDEYAEFDSLIDDLLAAGADPHKRDGRGNTVLHYCADDGLATLKVGRRMRRLFRTFLDKGVDINARNNAGRSALEMVMSGADRTEERREEEQIYWVGEKPAHPTGEERDEIVFAWFKEAGVRWTELDPVGRTLLHLNAGQKEDQRGPSRALILLENGVDMNAKDKDGITALDIAFIKRNRGMVDLLQQKGAESSQQVEVDWPIAAVKRDIPDISDSELSSDEGPVETLW